MKAIIKVTNPTTLEVVSQYELPYKDSKELKILYEEARQVWSEFQVEADTPEFKMGKLHTYQEELLKKNHNPVSYKAYTEELQKKGFVEFSNYKTLGSSYINRYEVWILPKTQETILLECFNDGGTKCLIYKPE